GPSDRFLRVMGLGRTHSARCGEYGAGRLALAPDTAENRMWAPPRGRLRASISTTGGADMNDATRFVAMSAKTLIDRYGIEAAAAAAEKASAKLRHGDAEGARIWLAVRNEVERLQSLDQGARRA